MHKTAPSGAVFAGALQAPMRDNQPAMPSLPPLAPLPLLTCPLCGRSNQCAVSTGAMAADCWCMHTPFSPDARSALAAKSLKEMGVENVAHVPGGFAALKDAGASIAPE